MDLYRPNIPSHHDARAMPAPRENAPQRPSAALLAIYHFLAAKALVTEEAFSISSAPPPARPSELSLFTIHNSQFSWRRGMRSSVSSVSSRSKPLVPPVRIRAISLIRGL